MSSREGTRKRAVGENVGRDTSRLSEREREIEIDQPGERGGGQVGGREREEEWSKGTEEEEG